MIFWVTNLIIKHNMKHPRIQVYQFDSLILLKKLNLRLFISLSTFFVKYKVIYRYEILIREIWEYHWIIRKAAIFHPRRTTSQTLWQIPAWWLVTHSHLDAQSIRGQHDSQTDPLGPHRPPPSPHPHTRLSRPGEGQRWGWTEVWQTIFTFDWIYLY